MNRTYQLSFCKRCKNKTFDQQKGIICSLTNNVADFQEKCESFKDIGTENMVDVGYKSYTNQDSISSLKSVFKVYLVTLFIGVGLFIGGLVIAEELSIDAVGVLLMIVGILSLVTAYVYSFIVLYRIWKKVIYEAKISGVDNAVETPGRAVGFLFIPFFNFYWVFMAYGQLPVVINNILKARNEKSVAQPALGIVVPIFMLLGMIPFLGTIFGFIVRFILHPVLLGSSINQLENLPAVTNVAKEEDKFQPTISRISDIKSFTGSFRMFNTGINYKLILMVTVGMLLANIVIGAIQRDFNSFGLGGIGVMLWSFLQQGISLTVFVLLCHSVKNPHGLAFSVAGTYAFLSGIWSLYSHLGNLRYFEIADMFNSYSMVITFINGLLVTYLFIYGVKYFGITFWVFAVASLIVWFITSILWHVRFAVTNIDDFSIEFKQYVTQIIYNIIYGLLFYFGLWWHLKPLIEKRTLDKTDMLDSDLT